MQDLKGKTIGVSSFASGGTNYAKGLMKTLGMESGRDYSLVEVGVGARAASAYQSKQIHAFSLWDEAYVTLSQNGIPFSNVIRDPRADGHAVGSILAKNADYKTRRQTLIGVGRAIAKAQLFQLTNPEAAVRIHWKVYPQTAPRTGITDAAVKNELNVLAVRTVLISKNPMKTNRWGDVPIDVMEKFQAYLVETEVLPKAVDVRTYYTNDLIDEINKFDETAIIRQAQGYKP